MCPVPTAEETKVFGYIATLGHCIGHNLVYVVPMSMLRPLGPLLGTSCSMLGPCRFHVGQHSLLNENPKGSMFNASQKVFGVVGGGMVVAVHWAPCWAHLSICWPGPNA